MNAYKFISQNLHQTCLTRFANHLIPLQDPQFVFAIIQILFTYF